MYCVDLGESFQMKLLLQNLREKDPSSLQPRTSPLRFGVPACPEAHPLGQTNSDADKLRRVVVVVVDIVPQQFARGVRVDLRDEAKLLQDERVEVLDTWGICTRRAGKLYKDRSRLYRDQILINFASKYKILVGKLSPRSTLLHRFAIHNRKLGEKEPDQNNSEKVKMRGH